MGKMAHMKINHHMKTKEHLKVRKDSEVLQTKILKINPQIIIKELKINKHL